MSRYRNHVVALASTAIGLVAASPAGAASLTEVSRSTWGATNIPSYIQMYIYVPDKLATKPPIMISAHSCGSTASGQMGNITTITAAADKNGFILVLPDNPGQNCWDVGSTKSLMHDGGGDTQGVAEMVKYAITKYSADPTRVYIMGGSSGAMLTQAMLAVYPDLFKAGHARAGVPAGCWADGYDSSQQWSNTCAAGSVDKTAMQWGDLARGMDPSYTGHRPRLQIVQGDADQTISFKNSAEAIKQWTNVLGLSMTPTSTDMTTTSIATYTRQFWKNTCGFTVLEAWAGKGGGHSMGYEQDAILQFFGLDTAGGPDPEDAACPDGSSGAGGASGGGTAGASGTGSGGGAGTAGTAGGAGKSGGGGAAATGGSVGTSTGGATATGGNSMARTGGSSGSGGVLGTGGNGSGGSAVKGSGGSASGGSSGSGGTQGSGGSHTQSGNGGSSSEGASGSSGGCSIAGGDHAVSAGAALLLGALGLIVRRRRRARG